MLWVHLVKTDFVRDKTDRFCEHIGNIAPELNDIISRVVVENHGESRLYCHFFVYVSPT